VKSSEVGYKHVWIKEDLVTLIPLADLHLGSPASRFKEFKKFLESHKNDYFVILGDLIDNALIDSLSNVYDQEFGPQKAIEKVIDCLEDVKDHILCAVAGNHEERTRKRVGIDIMKEICKTLDIPYSNSIFVLDLSVGITRYGSANRMNYIITCAHGYSSARTTGAKANSIEELAKIVANSDVYLLAHTHQPITFSKQRYLIDRRNKKLSEQTYWLVNVPPWIGYENYAARKLLAPPSPIVTYLRLSGEKKEVRIEMG